MATTKKIPTIFLSVSFILFLSLFFFVPKTLAGSYGVSVSCVIGSPGPCNTNVATIDMTNVVKVTYDSDNFDDSGYALVTGPSGATQQHNTVGVAFGHIPTGNVTSWFQFNGVGVYKIYLHAIDAFCCDVGAWANLTVTTLDPPTCTLSASPSSIASGDSSTLNWTTTNAASAFIDNGVGEVIPVVAGNITVNPTSTTTYTITATASSGSTIACQTTINVSSPTFPTGGLVPCGRLADNSATLEINESKPCDLCAAFYMLKNIINFATELALGIAIFVIVIAGLLYVFSAGDPGKIELAKSAITYALTGLALVFAAWLVIAIILQSLGYADINTWNQVNCSLQK